MGLNHEQRSSFERQGFVVVRHFFSADTVRRLSDWLDALRDKQPGIDEEAKYYERSPVTGENILVRVEHVLGPHNPDITELLLGPATTECLTELLGEPPVLFKEKVNYKPPGCRADKLHQDQAAGWNAYSDWFITMGIAIDPARRDNAALSFVHSGNYEKRLMGEEWQPLSQDDPPYQPEDEYTLIEADPGDVIFFDCYVPHGSPPNRSDRSRRMLFLTFNRQSDGDMRARYYSDKWASYPPNQAAEAREDSSYRV